MVETLGMRWRAGLPFDEVIALQDQLDVMPRQIPSERHLRPPVLSVREVRACWGSRRT